MSDFVIKTCRGCLVIILLTLISCSTQGRAPIVLNSDNDTTRVQNDILNAPSYPQSSGVFKRYKLHEALFTDTITSLAKRYNVSPHDIITLNKMDKPYYLESGEIIKIPLYDHSSASLSADDDSLKTPSNQVDSNMNTLSSPVVEPNKNTVTILPSLPNEQLQDYDY